MCIVGGSESIAAVDLQCTLEGTVHEKAVIGPNIVTESGHNWSVLLIEDIAHDHQVRDIGMHVVDTHWHIDRNRRIVLRVREHRREAMY
jgi:hypothetical protein